MNIESPCSHHGPTCSYILQHNCLGPHCRSTTIRRIWLHSHNYRSQLQQGILVFPMQSDHNQPRGSGTLHEACLLTLQGTYPGNIQPRYMLHVKLHNQVMQTVGHHIEYQHHIPSTDGWTVWVHEPMAETVPQNLLQLSAKQLGLTVANGAICP